MTTVPVQVLKDASETRAAITDLFEWAEEVRFAYAWMAVDTAKGSPWSAFPFAKIKHGVVGLQFAGTDVEVLEAFLEHIPDRVRVMYETQGTFHPKLVVGTRAGQACAVIGSSNFTRAAFSANYEVNLVLRGEARSAPIGELLAVIDGYYRSPKARKLDSALIEAYSAAWERKPKPPRLPLLPRGSTRKPTVKKPADLDVGWDRYYDLLLAQDDRNFLNTEGTIRVIPTASDDNAYLTELRRCRSAFSEHGSLGKMPLATRQIVAGFGESQGWFGRMGGAGYYKKLINTGASGLSETLDEIPTSGDVSDDLILRTFDRASSFQGVGLACWTRLLSMKRPDYFLSVNSANKDRIRGVFGSAPGSPRAYLELTRRILSLPWASASAPEDEAEREIWEGRVALLDAILYEPASSLS